jgi:hypothetical protein
VANYIAPYSEQAADLALELIASPSGRLQEVAAVQDDDGHWYVIPKWEMSTFYEMAEDGEIDEWVSFNERFSQYRTGGGLNLKQLFAKI